MKAGWNRVGKNGSTEAITQDYRKPNYDYDMPDQMKFMSSSKGCYQWLTNVIVFQLQTSHLLLHWVFFFFLGNVIIASVHF